MARLAAGDREAMEPLMGRHYRRVYRIALGAVSPTPLRATAAENALRGERITPAIADAVGELAAAATTPISDIRGSAPYRRAIVRTLTARVVQQAAARAAMAGAR